MPKPNHKPPRWKSTLAVILVIIGCLLVPFAALAAWLSNTLINTDGFVATVSPLSTNPAIDDAVASFVTNKLFSKINVQQQISSALPDPAKFLAAPLTERLQSFTQEKVNQAVGSPQFNKIWTEANRAAHQLFIKLVLNQGQAITTAQGVVSLDLSALFDQVKSTLNQNGVTIFDSVSLPQTDRQIVLLNSPQLAKLQGLISILNSLAIVLPVLAFVFLAGSAFISPHRLITAAQIGLGFIGAGLVLVILLVIGKTIYLGQTQLSSAPAAALYDTLTRALWSAGWAIFGFGIALFVGITIARTFRMIK